MLFLTGVCGVLIIQNKTVNTKWVSGERSKPLNLPSKRHYKVGNGRAFEKNAAPKIPREIGESRINGKLSLICRKISVYLLI